LESPEPPKPFCAIFILAVISFFLILVHSVFVLVFIGFIIAGFLYISAMVCISSGDSHAPSWIDKEEKGELSLLGKVDGLHAVFPETCPECKSVIDMNKVHMVDEITIMCPNCLTIIKGVLSE
jgi:hypothetical protein